MNRIRMRQATAALVVASFWASLSSGQSFDTPRTRLRPIDAPSAVDQYRPRTASRTLRETAYQNRSTTQPAGPAVRQTVMWQQGLEAPALPGGGLQLPQSNLATPGVGPALPPSAPVTAPAPSQRILPSTPANLQPAPAGGISSASDLAPIAPPQLGGGGFATINNCSCISPPSGYTAASVGCGPAVTYETPQTYIPPPAEIAAPAILPGGLTPTGGAPLPSLITFGQETNPVQIGQGIIGQPVAYVPGQPVRNFLRYLFP